jgi:hypothetical protein
VKKLRWKTVEVHAAGEGHSFTIRQRILYGWLLTHRAYKAGGDSIGSHECFTLAEAKAKAQELAEVHDEKT